MKFFLILISIFPFYAFAEDAERLIRAYRSLNIDYTKYEKKFLEQRSDEKALRATPIGSARLYNPANLPKGTGWSSVAVMQERFEQIRDERFLTLNNDQDFLRRISWLYPQDGCYIRAALFNRNAFRMFIPIPSTVFAFGNLRLKTNNSPRGVVGWWFHVAPLVQVGETKYVLDPAIEPERPLTIDEWLSRMGTPVRIKVAICGSGTNSPGGNCNRESDGMELWAVRAQKHFLELEEKQLIRMGRNPDAELGENPPWNAR